MGDFVIAAAEEFDETNPVTKRIGHVRDAAPITRLDLALDHGAGFDCPDDGRFNFRDYDSGAAHPGQLEGASSVG